MRLLVISGKKQSGKGCTFQFVRRLNDLLPVTEFSFAYQLKQICVEVLGLQPQQAWGTDEQKNTPVPHLLWEDFPVHEARRVYNDQGYVTTLRVGPMTGREVMQYWGSEIFRRQYQDVWAAGAIRHVQSQMDGRDGIAVITDCRFPNEVVAAQKAGGRVIRLTRNAFGDTHPSETALDDWTDFDHVCENEGLSVYETLRMLYPRLCGWGFVQEVSERRLDATARLVARTYGGEEDGASA